MRERRWALLIGAAAVAVIVLILVGIAGKKRDCDAQGGVLVRGLFEMVCIKGDAVLTPNAAISGKTARDEPNG